jgi:hypothetical protein
MVNELLEKRELLSEIAVELYGELYVTNDKFWGSPTEKQMMEVEHRLDNLGWRDDITPEMLEAAKQIAKDLGLDLGNEEEDYLGF